MSLYKHIIIDESDKGKDSADVRTVEISTTFKIEEKDIDWEEIKKASSFANPIISQLNIECPKD